MGLVQVGLHPSPPTSISGIQDKGERTGPRDRCADDKTHAAQVECGGPSRRPTEGRPQRFAER